MSHFLLIPLLAFVCEFVDSTLGMGYGTTLTPLLLLMGYSPLETVPAVLASETLIGFTAAFVHHRYGNVSLDFRNAQRDERLRSQLGRLGYLPKSRDARVALVLSLCSIGGATAAAFLALNLSQNAVELYIGVLVLTIGLFLIAKHRSPMQFRWSRIVGLGTLAAFNKGISGGGYGPLVTGGQIVAGLNGKAAVAITAFSESIASIAGVGVYWFAAQTIDWSLAPLLMIGALLSVPLTGLVVQKLPTQKLTLAIAVITSLLGLTMLVKALV